MPIPPRNPRRKTLGGISMNTPSKIPKAMSKSGNSASNNTAGSSATQNKKKRQSMLPRMTGNNTNSHSSYTAPVPPSSPCNSIQSTTSTATNHYNNRRQSISGASGNTTSSTASTIIKQDIRPIHDKHYQQQSMKTLLQFLNQNGYEYPVSMKSLSRPSGKDFIHMVTFLLQQLDPTFGKNNHATNNHHHGDSNSNNNNSMKLEEEIAMQFKALGYPFSVSKTALVAAGSPHTWPALLAALTWLVEHITVILAADDVRGTGGMDTSFSSTTSAAPFESLADLEQKTDRAFFTYLQKAYGAFLSGAVEKSDLYTEQFMDAFEQDNMILEREMDRITDLNSCLVEQIVVLQQDFQESLPTMAKKREEYATDLEQFHDLVRQMDDHHAALDKKVQERTGELQETLQQVQRQLQRVENLKHTIATQPLSTTDVVQMSMEHAFQKEALEKTRLFQQSTQEQLLTSQNELKSLWDTLELVVRDYMEQASELARSSNENSALNWKVIVNKTNNDASNDDYDPASSIVMGGNVDFVQWNAYLRDCIQRNAGLLLEARRDLQIMLDELEMAQEQYTEAMDQSKILDMKLTQLEETMASEQDSQQATLQVRLAEVDAIQNQVQHNSDPAMVETQIVALQRQCMALETMQRKFAEETILSKRTLQDEIQHAMQCIQDYHSFVQEELQTLEDYTLQQRNSIAAKSTKTLSPTFFGESESSTRASS